MGEGAKHGCSTLQERKCVKKKYEVSIRERAVGDRGKGAPLHAILKREGHAGADGGRGSEKGGTVPKPNYILHKTMIVNWQKEGTQRFFTKKKGGGGSGAQERKRESAIE